MEVPLASVPPGLGDRASDTLIIPDRRPSPWIRRQPQRPLPSALPPCKNGHPITSGTAQPQITNSPMPWVSLPNAAYARTRPGDEPRPELPAGTDTIPQIKHIVILMLQGHSYDNYLGLSGRGDGLSVDSSGTPVHSNPSRSGMAITSHHLLSTMQRPSTVADTVRASHLQWNDGACDGFVRSIEETSPGAEAGAAMGYWTADDLPFINSLAQKFPVADRWFASYLGPAIQTAGSSSPVPLMVSPMDCKSIIRLRERYLTCSPVMTSRG